MKLYKGDKIMQMVDKDQLDICLDAGWSKKAPEVKEREEAEARKVQELKEMEEEEARKAQELKEAEELAAKETEEAKEAQLLADKELREAEDAKKSLEIKKAASVPKKIVKISGSNK